MFDFKDICLSVMSYEHYLRMGHDAYYAGNANHLDLPRLARGEIYYDQGFRYHDYVTEVDNPDDVFYLYCPQGYPVGKLTFNFDWKPILGFPKPFMRRSKQERQQVKDALRIHVARDKNGVSERSELDEEEWDREYFRNNHIVFRPVEPNFKRAEEIMYQISYGLNYRIPHMPYHILP